MKSNNPLLEALINKDYGFAHVVHEIENLDDSTLRDVEIEVKLILSAIKDSQLNRLDF